MDTREKLRAFNTLQDARYHFADIELLKEKDSKSPAIKSTTSQSRKHSEVLYALLELATVDEIKKHRAEAKAKIEKKESEASERIKIIGYLEKEKVEFDTDSSLEELRALKVSIEEEKQKQKDVELDKEAEDIKQFLTDNNISFHPQLGIKKLRVLKSNTVKELKKETKPEETNAGDASSTGTGDGSGNGNISPENQDTSPANQDKSQDNKTPAADEKKNQADSKKNKSTQE